MELVTETSKTLPPHPVVTANRQACLVHIYPTGPGMGSRYALGPAPLIVGRDSTCDIQLNDQSVSRRHARIQPGGDGFYAVDLQSTNGTFVNDKPVSMAKLKDGDYLRIGNWIFRYLTGGNVEAEYHEEIYRLTIIDALTGIHNKRFLLEFLDREVARSIHHARPLSLVLFDLDHFKIINDQLGHLGGDCTLRELVTAVRCGVRREQLFARYGGEEFAIVLPETDRDGAMHMAERIRQLVENHAFHYEGTPYQVTISLGVVGTRGEESLTPGELIRRADANLYQAKREGRNRSVG